MAVAIDPICKMEVEISPDAIQGEVDGVTYYFCMQGCKDRFMADPQRFLNPDAPVAEKKSFLKKLFKQPYNYLNSLTTMRFSSPAYLQVRYVLQEFPFWRYQLV